MRAPGRELSFFMRRGTARPLLLMTSGLPAELQFYRCSSRRLRLSRSSIRWRSGTTTCFRRWFFIGKIVECPDLFRMSGTAVVQYCAMYAGKDSEDEGSRDDAADSAGRNRDCSDRSEQAGAGDGRSADGSGGCSCRWSEDGFTDENSAGIIFGRLAANCG